MSIVQLNPQLPVYVVDKGTGYAFAMIDYSQDHFLHFVVALNDSGEIWIVPNNEVKMQWNQSLGRIPGE